MFSRRLDRAAPSGDKQSEKMDQSNTRARVGVIVRLMIDTVSDVFLLRKVSTRYVTGPLQLGQTGKNHLKSKLRI